MMSGVGVSLGYGRERAPQDVLGSLDWLAREGFERAPFVWPQWRTPQAEQVPLRRELA